MQVAEFIVSCVERAGGAAELRGLDRIDALLPAGLNADGSERDVVLALDPAVLRQESAVELATIGSPLLDSLIAHAAARGTTSLGHLAPERLKRKNLREEVERTLLFSNCRVRYDDGEPDVWRAYSAQFNYRVSFLSDERRERFYVIPVNLWSNQVNMRLIDHLAATTTSELSSATIDAPAVPVSEAYATAQLALRRLVGEEIAQHQHRSQKRFSVDYLRVSDYYEQVTRELQSRRHDGDERRKQAIEGKLEAARAERERKLRELSEKYRLRMQARLTSARLLSQPKTFFRLFIDRGTTTRTLVLAYDSLLGRLEPPVCEGCRAEMNRVHVSTQARLLCAECGAKS